MTSIIRLDYKKTFIIQVFAAADTWLQFVVDKLSAEPAVANPIRGLVDRKRSEEHLQSSNESLKDRIAFAINSRSMIFIIFSAVCVGVCVYLIPFILAPVYAFRCMFDVSAGV